jgi:hypothetical protein
MCIEPGLWKLQQEWQGRGTMPQPAELSELHWIDPVQRQELPIEPGAELQVKKVKR